MQSLAEVRRRDRAMDDGWIRGFLRMAQWGFLATVVDGRAHLNSNLFVYDEARHAIYVHTARTGRTATNIEYGAEATFSAAVMGRVLPAAEALDFSVEYAGVVVYGRVASVVEADEKLYVLQRLLEKYAPHLRPGRDYRGVTSREMERTGVHRISIDEWSGKQRVAPADFPGAFTSKPLVPPVEMRARGRSACENF